jgi:hypothetical protein
MNEIQICHQTTRDELRNLKRLVNLGKTAHASEGEIGRSRAAAVLLFARSIRLGHRRLALIRLNLAISLGASVTLDQWNYCENIVVKNFERGFHDLFQTAKKQQIISETS